MFKHMTIKVKLLSSFSIIGLLVLALAIYSVIGINKSADGFTSYREMAKDTVLASRVQANMLMVRMNVKDFLKTPIQKEIDEFENYYKKTKKFISEALVEIQKPSRASKVKEMNELLQVYYDSFYKVVDFYKKRNEIVNNNLDINGKKIERLLTYVMLSAKKDGDIEAGFKAGQTIRTLLLARLYTAKYLMTNNLQHAIRVDKEFTELQKDLVVLRDDIQNPIRKQKLKDAVALIDQYKNGVKDIVTIIKNRNEIIDNKLNKIGPHIAKLAEDVKLSIKKDQDTIGPNVASQNSSLIKSSIVVSALIIIFVILLAIVIPSAISKSLRNFQAGLLSFFRFLNRETNDITPLDDSSKDELGVMSKVVNENINKTKKVIDEDNTLIKDAQQTISRVQNGWYSQLIESSTSNRSLEEFKNSVNSMIKATKEHFISINKVLEQYTNYDYTEPLKLENIEKGGVFELLVNDINKLREAITNMLIDNKANGLTLANSSDTLLENVQKLNTNSNKSAAALEETSAALEEMTGNISNNTENIIKMAGYAKSLNSSSNKGKELAEQTTVAMNDIDTEVNEISEAISVIDQIAFQTNILSLNAAVEASTAGEAGKGFAVVAQEVRNLASRSAEAANDIKTLVENATKKANAGKSIADEMIDGYTELNENIDKTIDLISNVESASKEQLHGIEQINDAVNSLDQQTQENAMIASETNNVALQTDEIAKLIVTDANEKEFVGKDQVKAKII